MAAKTYYLSNALLDLFCIGTTYTPTSPFQCYVGLFITNPATPGDTGTECSGAAYVREAVVFTADNLLLTYIPAPTSSPTSSAPMYNFNTTVTTSPAVAVTFPTAGGSWGTITGVGIWDGPLPTPSSTPPLPNLLYSGALAVPKAINTGDTVSFPPGSLIIQEV